MKKLFFLFVLLIPIFAFAGPLQQAHRAVIARSNIAAGDSYTDITFWWRCEAATQFDGTNDYSAGDDTPTADSAVEINSDAGIVGTNGIECPSGNDTYNFDISSNDIISGSSGTIALWWNTQEASWPEYHVIFRAETAAGDYLQLMTYSDGHLRFTWNGTTFTTDTSTLTYQTNYFIQCAWDITTNTVEITVNNTTELSTTATAISALTMNELLLGTEGGGSNYYLDNIMISDTYTRDFYPLRNTTAYPG